MRISSMIKMLSIVSFGVLTPHISKADVSIDRLMSSYIIAKAETAQPIMNDNDMKAFPYTIQVASYINEKDAISHVDELKAQEKDAKYYPTFVRGQIWFKVCVGHFTTKEEAESYKKGFVKRTDEPFAVVISWLDRGKSPDSNHEANPAAEANGDKAEKLSKGEKKRKPASATMASPGVLPTSKEASTSIGDELTPVGAFEAKKVSEKKMAAVEQKVAMNAPKPAGEPVAPVKAAKLDSATKTGEAYYSLQIGAYPSEKLAKENATKLGDKVKEVSFHEATVNGQVWYRVYVGKFKSKKEAEEYQKTMAGQPSLIRKISQ